MDDLNRRVNCNDPLSDAAGQPLLVGDIVMYSASNSGRLAFAEVDGFTKTRIRVRHLGGTYTWTGGPDRFVKVSLDA